MCCRLIPRSHQYFWWSHWASLGSWRLDCRDAKVRHARDLGGTAAVVGLCGSSMQFPCVRPGNQSFQKDNRFILKSVYGIRVGSRTVNSNNTIYCPASADPEQGESLAASCEILRAASAFRSLSRSTAVCPVMFFAYESPPRAANVASSQ